jgi:hypothetical protein
MLAYGKAMIDDPARPGTADSVEIALRERLARDEAMAGTIAPILRHLLANEDNSVFSDEIVARVRGMVGDVVRQLLDRSAAIAVDAEPREHQPEAVGALTEAVIASPVFLCHVHALALEWQLTERLQARLALDPVLPPLLQALIASPEPVTAELAMQFLAAQARFGQSQRRMRLPLAELPGDLLHGALVSMRTLAGTGTAADAQAAAAEAVIRADYDESRSRLGMISRLVTGMGGGAVAALAIGHAGVAIFFSALAIGSGQDRDGVALSTNEAQLARFAVALRAAGLKVSAIEEQLLAIHPDIVLPEGVERLAADRAAALLAVAGGGFAGH